MRLSRRRFLTISAAFAAAPGYAHAETWHGRAFGAEVSLTIRGERGEAAQLLEKARGLIYEIEALFSLYDPRSALSGLNRTGVLHAPDARFLELMAACDAAHGLTDGLFDPSIQPLWQVAASGIEHEALIGWQHVRYGAGRVTLGPRQALTFNGIAQGYATDAVSALLTAHGVTDVLVNIGEHRGTGGPWVLALQDPKQGHMGTRTLRTGAIATSSPQATPLGETGHILHPFARPRWSTVSVEAASATLADSLSTALVLAPFEQVQAARNAADVTRVTLVDFDGDLRTL